MTTIDTATAAPGALQLLPSTLLAPDAEAEEELWYRDKDTRTAWEPLDNQQQAKDIIRARTPRIPWAAIMRTFDLDDDGTFRSINTFEVLGWADRVYARGEVSRVGYQLRWSSWPVIAGPERRRQDDCWAALVPGRRVRGASRDGQRRDHSTGPGTARGPRCGRPGARLSAVSSSARRWSSSPLERADESSPR